MRPLAEIIAWRAHASWSTDAQIEQDLLLARAMVVIFSDKFLSGQLAMRGGTVLHKVHLAPATRYSEDIDLVLVGDRPIGDIQKGLERVLRPLLGKPVKSVATTLGLRARNLLKPSKIIRIVYEYESTQKPTLAMKVKIEVNYSETKPCYPLVSLPYHPPMDELPGPVRLVSYALDEMLGTKMRALLQRTQGRDLFDLHRACLERAKAMQSGNSVLFDPDRVVAAFASYMRDEGTTVTREEYAGNLAKKCQDRTFRADMSKVLPRTVKFDVDEAAQRVNDVIISRMRP